MIVNLIGIAYLILIFVSFTRYIIIPAFQRAKGRL